MHASQALRQSPRKRYCQGRPAPPAYMNFCFFSAGFRICARMPRLMVRLLPDDTAHVGR